MLNLYQQHVAIFVLLAYACFGHTQRYPTTQNKCRGNTKSGCIDTRFLDTALQSLLNLHFHVDFGRVLTRRAWQAHCFCPWKINSYQLAFIVQKKVQKRSPNEMFFFRYFFI